MVFSVSSGDVKLETQITDGEILKSISLEFVIWDKLSIEN